MTGRPRPSGCADNLLNEASWRFDSSRSLYLAIVVVVAPNEGSYYPPFWPVNGKEAL
jgi:hypothetical protein